MEISWEGDEHEVDDAHESAVAQYRSLSMMDRLLTLTWREPSRDRVAEVVGGAKYQVASLIRSLSLTITLTVRVLT